MVAHQASLFSTMSQSLLRFMSIASVILCNHLILTTPFSFYLQSFPVSGSFPVSRLFAFGGQSIGASASVSVLPVNIQGWFPWLVLISLQSKELTRVFSSTTARKHQFFGPQPSLWTNSHICTWPQLWLDRSLSAKWYLCFLIHCLHLSQLFFKGASVF